MPNVSTYDSKYVRVVIGHFFCLINNIYGILNTPLQHFKTLFFIPSSIWKLFFYLPLIFSEFRPFKLSRLLLYLHHSHEHSNRRGMSTENIHFLFYHRILSTRWNTLVPVKNRNNSMLKKYFQTYSNSLCL